jgi:hypothetical protein
MHSLSQIEKMVNTINKDLGLEENKLPAYGSDYGNRPTYVLVSNDGYSLIAFGHYRSKEQDRVIINTPDVDELLFEIFKEATRDIAIKYELENRVLNQDHRILYFQKHIEILESLHLERKYIDKLKDYHTYLLKLEKPPPLPDIRDRYPNL